MNSGRNDKRRSWCVHTLAAAAFISMSGCIIVSPPNDQPPPPQTVDAPPPPPPDASAAYVPADPGLQELVAPIALYPDPILADLLPAATYPDQVQQAAQFIQFNPTPPDDLIGQQNWDPSVQALVHYPSILQYMAANPQWTESLGAAFVNQQPQVMQAIQDLRAQAMAEGNLATNQDEYVDDEGGFIYIRPAEDGVIFVPFYDPVLVYHEHSNIDYRYRYRDGAWLDHGFDWEHHDVYTGDWHRGWTGGPGGWHRNPDWAPEQQHWAHDDRRGPVHQVAPANYAKPRELQGRDFHAVPTRTESPNHGPVQTPPARHDEHLQGQPHPDEQPAEHHDDHPQGSPHSAEQPAEHHDDKSHGGAPQPDNKPAPAHHDDHPQNSPHAADAPKHVNPEPGSSPPPPPPPPPPEQHARPMPPTKQAPPAKGKGPPQKPEGG
ncbi:MAG TPA: DUF3300 domain-containing protein, partial [Tepidisphaeraceae bacterium]